MRVTPTVFTGSDDVGLALASLIADGIAATRPGSEYLLGCPSGRSPHSTYAALADLVRQRDLDLSGLIIVMMDEYAERDADGNAVRCVDVREPHSCARFGRVEIMDRLNAAARPGRRIRPENLWLPDPVAGDAFDARIAEHGGIDLFILASGASDGHIAFNPPGADTSSRTRVVRLAEQTRRDNLSTFPTFDSDLDRVPHFGVTVGIGTIRTLSKRVVMVAHGEQKAEAVRRLGRAVRYEADWPATILSDCNDPLFFVDEAAYRASLHPDTHHAATSAPSHTF